MADWYVNLIEKYNCRFIARPSSYDWQWINCLYEEFKPIGKPRLPFNIFCLSTMKKICEDIGI